MGLQEQNRNGSYERFLSLSMDIIKLAFSEYCVSMDETLCYTLASEAYSALQQTGEVPSDMVQLLLTVGSAEDEKSATEMVKTIMRAIRGALPTEGISRSTLMSTATSVSTSKNAPKRYEDWFPALGSAEKVPQVGHPLWHPTAVRKLVKGLAEPIKPAGDGYSALSKRFVPIRPVETNVSSSGVPAKSGKPSGPESHDVLLKQLSRIRLNTNSREAPEARNAAPKTVLPQSADMTVAEGGVFYSELLDPHVIEIQPQPQNQVVQRFAPLPVTVDHLQPDGSHIQAGRDVPFIDVEAIETSVSSDEENRACFRHQPHVNFVVLQNDRSAPDESKEALLGFAIGYDMCDSLLDDNSDSSGNEGQESDLQILEEVEMQQHNTWLSPCIAKPETVSEGSFATPEATATHWLPFEPVQSCDWTSGWNTYSDLSEYQKMATVWDPTHPNTLSQFSHLMSSSVGGVNNVSTNAWTVTEQDLLIRRSPTLKDTVFGVGDEASLDFLQVAYDSPVIETSSDSLFKTNIWEYDSFVDDEDGEPFFSYKIENPTPNNGDHKRVCSFADSVVSPSKRMKGGLGLVDEVEVWIMTQADDMPQVPSPCAFSSDLEQSWYEETCDYKVQVPKLGATKRPGLQPKVCTLFLEARCARGEACKYSHDPASITCRHWEQRKCFKGSACPFLHGYHPQRSVSKTKMSESRSEEKNRLSSTSTDGPNTVRKRLRRTSAPCSLAGREGHVTS